jgi:DNA-binding XRE family transcriptional regulator/mannose-6-phosphate isomerase-like protein (cupin superfamily)
MDASGPSDEGSLHVRIRQAMASSAPVDGSTSSPSAVGDASAVDASVIATAVGEACAVAGAVGDASAVALLGERIRTARLQRGIGVRELARRVDCSASMISQIEKGLTNPSVSTLYSISRALGISTDSLIAGTDQPPSGPATGVFRNVPSPGGGSSTRRAPVVLHPKERRVINLERGVCWELLMPVPETNAEFMEVTYGVGGGSTEGEHAIRHNGREYSVILEGQLSVQIGFEQYVLEAGDSMAFDSTIPHRFWNAGLVPVRGIWFVVDRWPTSGDL